MAHVFAGTLQQVGVSKMGALKNMQVNVCLVRYDRADVSIN
jgi:hypothetical protein